MLICNSQCHIVFTFIQTINFYFHCFFVALSNRTASNRWRSHSCYVDEIFIKSNLLLYRVGKITVPNCSPSIRTRTCVYQEVKNISFSKNFAIVLNQWSLLSEHYESLLSSLKKYSSKRSLKLIGLSKIHVQVHR